MIIHRLILLALNLLLAAPWLALFPLAFSSKSWQIWREFNRMFAVGTTTLELVLLAAALGAPLGIAFAVLLFRTDIPGSRLGRFLFLFAFFLPLPVLAAGWQAVFRRLGISSIQTGPHGLLIAGWIHAVAALPFAVWLIGLALRKVDRDREETALLCMPAASVLCRCSLGECRTAIAFVCLAIAVQCLGEITVTDLTNTRTFAEEVYLQFSGDQYGLERSVALILPLIVVFVMIAGRMIRSDPVPQENSAPPLVFCLGRWRWFLLAGSALLVCVIGGAPFVALLQRAYTGPIAELWQGLFSVLRAHGKLIVESLFWSIFAGLLGSTAALALCWAAGDSSCGPDFPVGRLGKRSKWQARMPAPLGWRSKWQARMPAPCAWRRRMLFGLAITIWVTPGPVLGFGINSMIQYLLDVEDLLIGNNNDLHPLRDLLYLNPSPIPVLWAHTVRLFPFAVAILWPIVRSIPRDLIESARIDGAQGLSLFRTVVWPGTRRGFFLSLAVGTALAMGELSATKIAQVPGRRTFVEELFSQMHYGADSTVARLCLIYLVISGFLVALINRLGDFVSERQSRTYRT